MDSVPLLNESLITLQASRGSGDPPPAKSPTAPPHESWEAQGGAEVWQTWTDSVYSLSCGDRRTLGLCPKDESGWVAAGVKGCRRRKHSGRLSDIAFSNNSHISGEYPDPLTGSTL